LINIDKKEELLRAKIKLAEVLHEIGWLMPEDELYETFPDVLRFIKGYY